jgi:hypothetical protein
MTSERPSPPPYRGLHVRPLFQGPLKACVTSVLVLATIVGLATALQGSSVGNAIATAAGLLLFGWVIMLQRREYVRRGLRWPA